MGVGQGDEGRTHLVLGVGDAVGDDSDEQVEDHKARQENVNDEENRRGVAERCHRFGRG